MIFHIGQRVRNIKSTAFIPKGTAGTVAEESSCPWVVWDNGVSWCREDKFLELLNDDKTQEVNQ